MKLFNEFTNHLICSVVNIIGVFDGIFFFFSVRKSLKMLVREFVEFRAKNDFFNGSDFQFSSIFKIH